MTRQLQQRISTRQREALQMIRDSGERVVIEDDWLIYLADSQRCPFGIRNSRLSDDASYVRSQMKRSDWQDEAIYRQERNEAAKGFGTLAIELIQAGHYEDAQVELKKADHYSLAEKTEIEMYEFRTQE